MHCGTETHNQAMKSEISLSYLLSYMILFIYGDPHLYSVYLDHKWPKNPSFIVKLVAFKVVTIFNIIGVILRGLRYGYTSLSDSLLVNVLLNSFYQPIY